MINTKKGQLNSRKFGKFDNTVLTHASDTSDFTKRTITPVMASLAELLRNTKKYQTHYDWFVDLARNFHDVRLSLFYLELRVGYMD